ncbi:MAG: type II toxin-antitoxin system Phd/YefM family antitoxin [Gammaproteobacteria bacterium]
MQVTVRDLKNHLSEYLRRVQAGEEIIVTSHGRRVARFSAVAEASGKIDPEEAAIARLRAQPWIRPGKGGKIEAAEHPIRWKPGEKTLSEIVMEDRE